MIRFIKQKLLHKKWMVISLLIGNILLVAIASSNPMYQNAALQKTLFSKINTYIQKENANPGVLEFESTMKGREGQETEYKNLQSMAEGAAERLDVEQTALVTLHETTKTRGNFVQSREQSSLSKTLRIASLSDLENHITMMSGEMYKDQVGADGMMEGIVSQRALSKLNLVVGDELELKKFLRSDKTYPKVKIVGVYSNSEEEDTYWVNSPSDYYMEIFVAPSVFEETFMNLEKQEFDVTTDWFMIFDYNQLKASRVDELASETNNMIADVRKLFGQCAGAGLSRHTGRVPDGGKEGDNHPSYPAISGAGSASRIYIYDFKADVGSGAERDSPVKEPRFQ